MASVYRRKDGRWSGQFIVELPSGEKKRRSVSGKTRREVEQKISLALVEISEGKFVDTSDILVDQFLTDWIKNSHSIKESTQESYSSNIKLHIIPAIGHIQLQKLRPFDVQNMLSQLRRKGLSGRTVQYNFAILRKALNQAKRWGMISLNPCDSVEKPKPDSFQIKPLNEEEAQRLLDTAKRRNDQYYALFVVSITSGLRLGETLGLQWSDIDLKTGELFVRHTLNNRTRKLAEPKTPNSRRRIQLSEVAINAIKTHRKRQMEERLKAGSGWDTTYDLIFTTNVGTPINQTHLRERVFHKILSEAGLERIRFHDLRHTCATLLLQKNVHPKIVSELLGHASVSLTLDTYSHFLPTMSQKVAQKMDEVFKEDRSNYRAVQ